MYRNAMEIFVEQKLEQMWKNTNSCHCRRCHDDIMAYALNHLPTKYVSTSKGELYNRAAALSIDHGVVIIKALTEAMKLVEEHPRHPVKESHNGYQVFRERD